MKKFVLISIQDFKKIKIYADNGCWRRSVILPCFRDTYVCYSCNKAFTFDELMILFLKGTEDERIGAISIIAEKFSRNLYAFLKENVSAISLDEKRFLLEYVISDYLPLILPKEKIKSYVFRDEFSGDIWVNILNYIKENI